jgi:proteic killer suppression protein
MEVEFADENLDRLETELQFTAGFDRAMSVHCCRAAP